MLYLTMNKSDYVVVDGNIFVGYGKKNGNGIRVWIDAPTEIDITRGTFYEKELLKLSKEGNEAARALLERLEIEHDERIDKSRARQAKLKAARFKVGRGLAPAVGADVSVRPKPEPEQLWDILKTSDSIEGEVQLKSSRMRKRTAYVSP